MAAGDAPPVELEFRALFEEVQPGYFRSLVEKTLAYCASHSVGKDCIDKRQSIVVRTTSK